MELDSEPMNGKTNVSGEASDAMLVPTALQAKQIRALDFLHADGAGRHRDRPDQRRWLTAAHANLDHIE